MESNDGEGKGGGGTLLQELCGADAELYAYLSTCLYLNPSAAISPRDLASLTKEAEEEGNFRPALDKAILEGAQNPAQRPKYVKVIQDLASRSMRAAEQERASALSAGRSDLAASLGRRIENQRFVRERAEDILDVATRFYAETLLTLGEDAQREERRQARRVASGEEARIGQAERAEQQAKRRAAKGLGREQRRDAQKESRKEALAAAAREEARADARRVAEGEERRIGEVEAAGREARRSERKEKQD